MRGRVRHLERVFAAFPRQAQQLEGGAEAHLLRSFKVVGFARSCHAETAPDGEIIFPPDVCVRGGPVGGGSGWDYV